MSSSQLAALNLPAFLNTLLLDTRERVPRHGHPQGARREPRQVIVHAESASHPERAPGEHFEQSLLDSGKHSFARCTGSLKPGWSYLATDGLQNIEVVSRRSPSCLRAERECCCLAELSSRATWPTRVAAIGAAYLSRNSIRQRCRTSWRCSFQWRSPDGRDGGRGFEPRQGSLIFARAVVSRE